MSKTINFPIFHVSSNYLGIALSAFQQEGARWLFYEANYQNIKQIFNNILKRASRSNIDKEQTLSQLFGLLKLCSERSIGKRFALDEVYKAKQTIIKSIIG
jgi:hypothetical protein